MECSMRFPGGLSAHPLGAEAQHNDPARLHAAIVGDLMAGAIAFNDDFSGAHQ